MIGVSFILRRGIVHDYAASERGALGRADLTATLPSVSWRRLCKLAALAPRPLIAHLLGNRVERLSYIGKRVNSTAYSQHFSRIW